MKIDLFKRNSAQATVELAVMFPVIIIIAVIAVNAIMFFGNCAKFDRLFNQTVTMLAVSPAYNQTTANCQALVQDALKKDFDDDYLSFEVSVTSVNSGMKQYSGTLKMHPTLFGLGLKQEVFGISIPPLSHIQKITIDQYKPGVMF